MRLHLRFRSFIDDERPQQCNPMFYSVKHTASVLTKRSPSRRMLRIVNRRWTWQCAMHHALIKKFQRYAYDVTSTRSRREKKIHSAQQKTFFENCPATGSRAVNGFRLAVTSVPTGRVIKYPRKCTRAPGRGITDRWFRVLPLRGYARSSVHHHLSMMMNTIVSNDFVDAIQDDVDNDDRIDRW